MSSFQECKVWIFNLKQVKYTVLEKIKFSPHIWNHEVGLQHTSAFESAPFYGGMVVGAGLFTYAVSLIQQKQSLADKHSATAHKGSLCTFINVSSKE